MHAGRKPALSLCRAAAASAAAAVPMPLPLLPLPCSASGGSVQWKGEARQLLEAAVAFTESTLKAVWDGTASSAAQQAQQQQPGAPALVVEAAEPMLAALLALQVADAGQLAAQARGLEAFGRLLAARHDLVPGAASR
jgi:hypothetical protein